MNCLTDTGAIATQEQCGFLAVNLYAKSKFGEDALANVSVQKAPGGKVQGFVRIRSRTQGIAISLGENIKQKVK